ncbi:MAG: ABC transporter permease [Bilifractor sp.]|jgi:ribose transport system permease protein
MTGTGSVAKAEEPKRSLKEVWREFVNNYLIITGIVVLMVYTAIMQPTFFSYSNISSILKQLVPLGLVSLGMTLIVIGGYIDLSVAGMFSFLSMLSALLYNKTGAVSFLLIILIGALCGGINALILIGCGARDDSDALFITFGMSTVFTAMALMMNDGSAIILKQSNFTKFLGQGSLARVPFMVYIFAIFVILLQFMMKKTQIGRGIHLSGSNPTAASLCGISASKVIAIVYVVTGALVGIGAYLITCRVGNATPVVGKNYETNAIMSVAIGGTSLQGGHGSVVNTLIGVALVTIMINSLNILGIDQNMQFVWRGAILVIAIWLDARREI